ncbi:MAG: SUMF1/EgtB/PvdO family nonheme iron enzyme [Rikenellaceae bacterium]
MKNFKPCYAILLFVFFVVSCDSLVGSGDDGVDSTQITVDNNILNGGFVEMIFVEGGTFSRTLPDHEVTVRSFYISKYEITQSKWEEVTGSNPSKELLGDELPVNFMSWYTTIEFCNELSVREGLDPYYTVDKDNIDPNNLNEDDSYKWIVTINQGANGYCIPTEAEWEWAARGGLKHQGYNYAGSNNIDEVGWYRSNADGTTHPVGEKLPNELGIYDMTGNGWEWCWDWCPDWRDGTMPYDYDEGSQLVDPTGVESGSQKAIRGTCWMMADGESSYITYRCNTRPYMGDKTMTVRLVRVAY